MVIESRPSTFTGLSWWLVLSYKDFHAEEMLPADFMGMTEEMRHFVIAPLAERMRQKLKPILVMEDALDNGLCPQCGDKVITVGADEPYSNEHRQCVGCDSTFEAKDA